MCPQCLGSPYTTNSGIYEFYTDVGHSVGEFTGANVPDMAWRQAQLSLRRREFCMHSLFRYSSVACIESFVDLIV